MTEFFVHVYKFVLVNEEFLREVAMEWVERIKLHAFIISPTINCTVKRASIDCLVLTHPPANTHTHAQDIIGKKLKVATENILRRGTISISRERKLNAIKIICFVFRSIFAARVPRFRFPERTCVEGGTRIRQWGEDSTPDEKRKSRASEEAGTRE